MRRHPGKPAKADAALGDRATAMQLNRLVLGAREQLGDDLGVSSTLYRLSDLSLTEGDFGQARSFAQRGLGIATSREDTQMMMDGNFALAEVALAEQRYDEAQVYASEALRLARLRAYPASELDAEVLSLRIALERGDRDAITEGRIETLRLRSEAEGARTKPLKLAMFEARLHADRGEPFEARNVLQGVFEAATELNERKYQARALLGLADLALSEADPDSAAEYLEQAERFNPPAHPFLLLQARLQAARGRHDDALALAYEARQKSGDWWRAEESAHLEAIEAQDGRG